MVCKHAYAQKLSALQFIEVCERLAISVAALGFQDQSQGTQHAIVIEWLQPLHLQLESRRRLIDGLEKVPDPRFTTVGPLDSRHRVDQLHVGVTEGEVRVNVRSLMAAIARLTISTFSSDIAQYLPP